MSEEKLFKEYVEKKCKVCDNKLNCKEELHVKLDNTISCMKFKCKNCNKIKECFDKEG